MKQDKLEDLPKEAFEKMEAFKAAFKIFFKNHQDAVPVLKIGQSSISRYLAGSILVPMDVAQRFSDHTKGVVDMKSICFDLSAYTFDQRIKRKSDQSH